MKRYLLAVITLIFLISACKNHDRNLVINKPFPQEPAYTGNYILPSNYSREELTNLTKYYYDDWKKRYIKQCDDGSYYVDFTDEDPNVATVSEAMGYGMMITAYMAGYDDEAKTIFDGMYQFYKNHPSNICRYFMAWRQGTDCQSTGFDSATDGDEDIAFALLLADVQWGSDGDINYKEEAIQIINALKTCAFNSDGFPLLGDWVDDGTQYSDATRSSDWMPDHYLAFYRATGDNYWLLVNKRIIAITDSIQKNHSPNTGLIPDFIINANTSPAPAPANFLESQYDGAMYYNACRTPWRLTTGQLFVNDIQLGQQIEKINNWIQAATDTNANNIKAGYQLDGTPIGDYQDICFTGGFAVAAMLSGNQDWLNSCIDALIQPDIDDNTYFGNTLRMLYLLVLSGSYWIP